MGNISLTMCKLVKHPEMIFTLCEKVSS